MTRRTVRLGAVLWAGAAGVALLALVVGVPLLLAVTIGNPAAGLPDLLAGDVSDTVVINLLAVVAYLAWAQFALAVAGEVLAAIRHAPAPRLPGIFAGQQHLAHTLVAAALLAAPAVSVAAAPPAPLTSYAAPASTSTAYTDAHPASPDSVDAGSRVHGNREGRDTGAWVSHLTTLHAGTPTVTPATQAGMQQSSIAAATTDPQQGARAAAWGHAEVVIDADGPGTYWDLAVAHLGDGQRWPEIWNLNEGRRQANGEVMTTPGLLRPGWTVLIPSELIPEDESRVSAKFSTSAEGSSPDGPAAGEVHRGAGVVVEPGDSLSGIAAEHDTEGWDRLWEINRGRVQPDGEHLEDPDHIEPGWVINLQPAAAPEQAASSVESRDRSGDAVPVVPTSSTRALPRHRAPTAEAPAAQAPVRHGAVVSPGSDAGEAQAFPAGGSGERDDDDDLDSGTVMLVGAGFGGGLLTGLSLAALAHRRRRQFRYRRPGRAIASTPPDLLGMERVVRSAGSAGIVDVTWLDQALRSLSHHLTRDPHGQLPDILAVRMTHDVLELVLAEPLPDAQTTSAAPAPWAVGDGGRRWSVRRGDDLGYNEQQREFNLAPYPALVSVGYTAEGEQWLLDLERIGLARLTGDPGRCQNLLRFIGAELAHNAWSDELDVDLVGVGEELTQLNPDRLRHTSDPAAAVETYLARRAAVRDILNRTTTDVLTGRLRNIDGADMLMPRVLLIGNQPPQAADPAGAPADTGSPDNLLFGGSEALDRVRDIDRDDLDHGRAAVAAVVFLHDIATGTARTAHTVDARTSPAVPPAGSGWDLSVDQPGVLRIPALGLELIAQQVPEREAAALAQLLAAAAHTTDRPMPPARGDRPWDAHADAAGALLPEITVHRSSLPTERHAEFAAPTLHLATRTPDDVTDDTDDTDVTDVTDDGHHKDARVSSVLPAPASTYVRACATTEEDVAALAPGVPDEVCRQVQDADPTLDTDLAAWHDPACPLPRLTLLGPVDVRAHGPLPEVRPRRAWNVEIVAYLASQPRGVTAEQFGTDLWPGDADIAGKSKLRQAIHIARKWLGTNPRTGRDHLPPASPSPGGPALYRVEDVLVDAELFRRLRLRGAARGADGIADLQAALNLVTGPPLDQRRPGGYGWLAETPLDHEYTGMIVDVSHLVGTHYLAAGEPELARAAAQTALNAGSTDDIALLDLVAACDAQGNRAEADRIVKRILANHDAEVEEDLPPRTAQILHRRRWIGQAS